LNPELTIGVAVGAVVSAPAVEHCGAGSPLQYTWLRTFLVYNIREIIKKKKSKKNYERKKNSTIFFGGQKGQLCRDLKTIISQYP